MSCYSSFLGRIMDYSTRIKVLFYLLNMMQLTCKPFITIWIVPGCFLITKVLQHCHLLAGVFHNTISDAKHLERIKHTNTRNTQKSICRMSLTWPFVCIVPFFLHFYTWSCSFIFNHNSQFQCLFYWYCTTFGHHHNHILYTFSWWLIGHKSDYP